MALPKSFVPDAPSTPKSFVPDNQPQGQQQGGNILDAITSFLFPATKNLPNAVNSLTQYEGQQPNTKGNLLGSIGTGLNNALHMGETAIKPALELGSYMAPIGKSVKGAIALGGLSGAMNGAAQQNANPASTGIDAVTGALTGGLLKGVSPALNSAGQDLEQKGIDNVMHGLRPSPTQMTNFEKSSGMDLPTFLKKYNITDNFSDAAAQHINELQGAFDDIAKNSGKVVPHSALDEAFAPKIQELNDSVIPQVKAKGEDLQTVLDNIKAKYPAAVDVGNLTSERRAFDTQLADGQFSMPAEQANYLKSARNATQEAVQKATEGLTYNGSNLKDLGKELSNFYDFQKIADFAKNKSKGNLQASPLRLLSSAGLGGLLGLFGGPGAAVAGYAIPQIMNTPGFNTAMSKTEQGVGQGMQNIAKKQAPTALLQLLRGLPTNTVNAISNNQ